jgi:signal transduction histidine kinase
LSAANGAAVCWFQPPCVRYRTEKGRRHAHLLQMLHEFLTNSRAELIERCRLMVEQRRAPLVVDAHMVHGIPLFLDQLIKTLQVEQSSEPCNSRKVSGPADGRPALSEIGTTAALHGLELSRQGFTVEQVVHDYGDLCQTITELALERNAPIEIGEFRTLNRCLDNAIADAVREFAVQRSATMESEGISLLNERFGSLAHELRNHIHTATLAVMAIKAGNVGLTGATGTILDRSLIGMRNLIDRSLADARTTAGMSAHLRLISLADFVADVKIAASLEAQSKGCKFTVGDVDKELALNVDRDLLFSAVGNLLQNAFKFTKHGTEVSLSAYAAADRIRIDVEDHCGGLPPGAVVGLFRPFIQRGGDRSGLGLGLAICRRSVEASNGILRVHDIAGSGCVFTIDLPRYALGKAIQEQATAATA